MTNIYDVAKSAGVSRSTVSRVLNDSVSVSEETRQKVLNIIKKLNYNPNSAARSLALKKNNTIAVISGYMLNDPFFSNVAEGIYKTADKMGYGTIFCVNQKDTNSNVHYFNMLFGKVDGIVFLGYDSVLRAELLKFLDVKDRKSVV